MTVHESRVFRVESRYERRGYPLDYELEIGKDGPVLIMPVKVVSGWDELIKIRDLIDEALGARE